MCQKITNLFSYKVVENFQFMQIFQHNIAFSNYSSRFILRSNNLFELVFYYVKFPKQETKKAHQSSLTACLLLHIYAKSIVYSASSLRIRLHIRSRARWIWVLTVPIGRRSFSEISS